MLKTQIFNDYETLSAAAADIIIDLVKDIPDAVLCFATGNTPVGTYRLLAEKAKEQNVDFSKCFCLGLDEWVGVPPGKSGSCHFILQQQVFIPLGIRNTQVHLFDGMAADMEAECKKMDALILEKGGIDCMLVGVGLNGHIGFNEPGTLQNSKAHVQELHQGTLASGQHYFNEPTVIKNGITLGLSQVLEARTLLMLACGKSKSAVIQQILEQDISEQVPASHIRLHSNGVLLLDKDAASQLKKYGTDPGDKKR